MARFRIHGIVSGSKYLGEIEADNKEEAIEKGFELDACYVSMCHQCSREIEDPEVREILAEKIE